MLAWQHFEENGDNCLQQLHDPAKTSLDCSLSACSSHLALSLFYNTRVLFFKNWVIIHSFKRCIHLSLKIKTGSFIWVVGHCGKNAHQSFLFSLICSSWALTTLEKLSSHCGRSSFLLLLWSCQTRKSPLLLSFEVEEMNVFCLVQATVHKLLTEGVQLNSPAVPAVERGVCVSGEDPHWVVYRWKHIMHNHILFKSNL